MSGCISIFYRYVTILQLIPHHPRYITTPDLLYVLEKRGIYMTHRSIQRDLAGPLSIHFPIICDNTFRPYRWSMDSEYQIKIPMPSKCTTSANKCHYSSATAA